MSDECASPECECQEEGHINIGYVVINSPDLTFVQSEAELSELYAPGTAVWFTEDEGETFRKVVVPEKKTLREWIPVKERLPKAHTRVLLWETTRNAVGQGIWYPYSHQWAVGLPFGDRFWTGSSVSHWQPLPKRPAQASGTRWMND